MGPQHIQDMLHWVVITNLFGRLSKIERLVSFQSVYYQTTALILVKHSNTCDESKYPEQYFQLGIHTSFV